MSCQDCIDKTHCSDTISSTCVKWNGDIYSDFDMCINDSLTSVVNTILDKIRDLLKGRGIEFEDEDLNFDDCSFLEDIQDDEIKSLINILNTYKTAICQLKTSIDQANANLASFAVNSLYTLGCITIPADPCGDPLVFKDLIQAMIDKICALNTQLTSIAASILDTVEDAAGNFLVGGAIKSCGNNGIVYSGTGASAVVTFQALVPPYSPILYTGSTSYFDSNGIGLPNTVMCGWYLCNGNNGTPLSSALPQNMAGTLQYIIRFT